MVLMSCSCAGSDSALASNFHPMVNAKGLKVYVFFRMNLNQIGIESYKRFHRLVLGRAYRFKRTTAASKLASRTNCCLTDSSRTLMMMSLLDHNTGTAPRPGMLLRSTPSVGTFGVSMCFCLPTAGTVNGLSVVVGRVFDELGAGLLATTVDVFWETWALDEVDGWLTMVELETGLELDEFGIVTLVPSVRLFIRDRLMRSTPVDGL